MKNKTLNIQRLRDKLYRHGCLTKTRFEKAWNQLRKRGWYAIEGDGGWITGYAI